MEGYSVCFAAAVYFGASYHRACFIIHSGMLETSICTSQYMVALVSISYNCNSPKQQTICSFPNK
jgi:hypothetical protein